MKSTKNTNEVAKMKKQEIIDEIMKGYMSLGKNIDKSLKDRIFYTSKQYKADEKQVPKDVLAELLKDIREAVANVVPTGNTTTPAPVEASAKPKLKKPDTAKAETPKAETPKTTDKSTKETPKTPAPKAPAKETGKPKTAEKTADKAKVETTADITKNAIPMAKIFPAEIDHALGHLVAQPSKFKTMDEIAKAIEDGVNIFFAGYWTKRHLKEYNYAETYSVPVPKDGFPFDLDILQAVYVCEGVKRLYAISTTTEAMFRFDEEDLVRVTTEAPNGDKFTMRYSVGLEYEIYEVVEK